MKIVVLAGGVGAARFLEGLVQIINPAELTVIVNTGDDEDFYGLRVCPDIDTIIYTLSGNHDEKQGWGVKNETFFVSKQLEKLGNHNWFVLGDKDLATHIHRTNLLKQGRTLSEITKDIADHFSIKFKLLPMTNDEVKTMVKTPDGTIPFQEYFVKRRHTDDVLSVTFTGIKNAKPAPGVLETIEKADAIIIAPSNPIVSIGTILAIPTIKQHIKKSKAKKIAISPIVGGKAIKGPAEKMLRDLGIEPSAFGVAKLYKEFLNTFIIDTKDKEQKEKIEKLGFPVVVTNTIMQDLQTKKILAQTVIDTI
jgi:LPPG:FO 2-phospho-L-lactate transferase